jgi:hypothetical protein
MKGKMMANEQDFEKLPGLYQVWDLALIVMAGRTYKIEDVGVLADGGALFAVYVALNQILV